MAVGWGDKSRFSSERHSNVDPAALGRMFGRFRDCAIFRSPNPEIAKSPDFYSIGRLENRRRCFVQPTSSRIDQPGCTPTPGALDAAVHAPAGGNYRWLICALLFFATTINYMDRQV